MEAAKENFPKRMGHQNKKYCFNIRRLRISLKYRPEILKLVLKMRQCIREKNLLLKKLKHQLKLKLQENQESVQGIQDHFTKTRSEEKLFDNTSTQQNKLSEQIDSKTSMTQTDCLLLQKDCIDKSTIYELSVKDSYSQTRNDTNDLGPNMESNISDKEKNIDSKVDILTSNESVEKSSSDAEQINLKITDITELTKVAFTQTESILCEVTKDSYTQTDKESPVGDRKTTENEHNKLREKVIGWKNVENGEEEKSIAEQVKEVAQSAMRESGMVYVESAGMYYDYKTGYYYNSELGLYYHSDTGCYYYYSDEQKTFVFHSYPDRSGETKKGTEPPKRKAKKHKKDEDDDEASKPKRKKTEKRKKIKKEKKNESKKDTMNSVEDKDIGEEKDGKDTETESKKDEEVEIKEDCKESQELEDGECSDSADDISDISISDSDTSTATASDDETVAKHHPPCMRLIVRETNLPKLKVGSLFLVTKDGGSIGREGEQHAILLKDCNVSKHHLDIKFDSLKRIYTAVDMGSKNGTILNGVRMSDSQEFSDPMEVVHGSMLQLGVTKLLCHIHAGNDTCGHCEPGLIMEAEEKETKAAYTRTCSIQKQHQLELARLKNKYAPKPLAIEETAYNDRAQSRREKVGSSHHAEKTQRSDLDTHITQDNKGFKLLEKMGWSKGEGLGKDSQGDTDPIPLIANEGKTGLGAAPEVQPLVSRTLGPATMRLAARTKMLQPPAKAFQDPLEEDSE